MRHMQPLCLKATCAGWDRFPLEVGRAPHPPVPAARPRVQTVGTVAPLNSRDTVLRCAVACLGSERGWWLWQR